MSGTDYLLGHDATEWDRLAEQHLLWRATLVERLPPLGVVAGRSVLEVGCGPGHLLRDLAELVGPTGHAAGLELDEGAVQAARELLEHRPWVDVHHGDLMETALGGPWDVIVARWVLSFLPDVEHAVARLAAALAPAGRLVVQDYNHDGLRLFPRRAPIARAIEAIRDSWTDSGGDLWVTGRLPGILRAAELQPLIVEPQVKAGPPGSPVWCWVERFLHGHIDRVVSSGHLSRSDRDAFFRAWSEAAEDPGSVLFSPMQVLVVGERR